MNLHMVRPKNETETLLLPITKNCETLIKRTHTKPRDTLDFKLTKPREIFSFKASISIEGSRMIGLGNLEECNSVFIITEEKNKFELYTGNFDKISFAELKDELVKMLDVSNITPEQLQKKI